MKFKNKTEIKTYLLNSNPEEVFKWFKKNSDVQWNYLDIVYNDQTDDGLSSRKEPAGDFAFFDQLIKKNNNLIKLALAKFTNDYDLLKDIFNSTEDEGIRCAVLSNEQGEESFKKHIFGSFVNFNDNELLYFINHSTEAERYAFFSNKTFTDGQLEVLFERKRIFAKLSEEKWCNCIISCRDNPHITKSFDERERESGRRFMVSDGFSEYRSNKTIELLWALLTKVDVSDLWFSCFNQLFKNILYREKHLKADQEIPHLKKIFDRWNNFKKGYLLMNLTRCILSTAYQKEIGNFIKNYDNKFVREGYLNFFTSRNGEDDEKFIHDMFNRDYISLVYAFGNKNLMSRYFPKMSKAFYEIIFVNEYDEKKYPFDSRQGDKDAYEHWYKKFMQVNPGSMFKYEGENNEMDFEDELFMSDEEVFKPNEEEDSYQENIALGTRVVKHHSLQILDEARNNEVDNKKFWNSLGKLFKEKSEVDKYTAETNITLQSKILKNLDTLTKLTGSIKTLLQYVFITGVVILIFLLFK